jgi:alpha-L-rhamnosidase
MKKIYYLAAILVAAFCLCGSKPSNPIYLVNLKSEMQIDPVGISTQSPRLSWQIQSKENGTMQTSYHILVASTQANLKKDMGDLWDSGVVNSDQSQYVQYKGKVLKSGQKVYWKVKVNTNKGETKYSDECNWQMSMLSDEKWAAQWIGGSFSDDLLDLYTKLNARYLRKDFTVNKKVASATMYVCGLGVNKTYVNGSQLGGETLPDGRGEQMLMPTLSGYDKSVYYNTFDVTSFLKKGENTIGVILGNGRFVSLRYNPDKKPGFVNVANYGYPQLLLQLDVTYMDGTISRVVSDPSWMITNHGPIRENNEYDGEGYDARLEMDGWNKAGFVTDAKWKQVEKVEAPKGVLKAQPNPNMKIMDIVNPIKINDISPNGATEKTYVLDMGQNMVGVLELKNIVGQQPGDSIKMHFTELLKDDGTIYYDNLRSAKCTDVYVCDGRKIESWKPSFLYHGFRFVEIKGLRNKPELNNFVGKVFYDAMASTATLETSNDIINGVFKNAFWGVRGNYHGMPTDCPQRDERMGWLGDHVTGCYGESYLFDNHALYSKWMYDIEDAQRPTGSVPDLVPVYWSNYSNNLTWPAVFLTGPDMIYRQYGDPQPIIDYYPAMKKWLTFMKERYCKEGIIYKDTYGDWCMPPESPKLIHSKDPSRITKGAVMSTSFYYYLCGLMSEFAPVAGHPEDVDYYKNEQAVTKDAFNKKFYNAEKGYYDNNTVTANILPLSFGMVPEGEKARVFANIEAKTEGEFNGHVSTGVVGIQQLMRGLTINGAPELALKIATNDTYPSWGYMYKHGATTIWELWNGDTADPAMNSGNHVMLLGDLIIWDMGYIGGISAAQPGFKSVQLKPYPIKGLDFAKATYESVYGTISSNWKKSDGRFEWSFTIPANTTANVYVPVDGTMSSEDMNVVCKAGGKFVSQADGFAQFTFGSGTYNIVTALKK